MHTCILTYTIYLRHSTSPTTSVPGYFQANSNTTELRLPRCDYTMSNTIAWLRDLTMEQLKAVHRVCINMIPEESTDMATGSLAWPV